MLNTFPFFLTYGLLAPFILRLALGLVFIHAGYLKIFKRQSETVLMFSGLGLPMPKFLFWLVALVEVVGGIFLVAGFLTQVSALLIALISLCGLYIKIRHKEMLVQSVDFYIFALVMALSLVLSGAGFFALDMPL